MIEKIADNILSPLGMTTEENYLAVKEGRSSLALYEDKWGIPEPFTASLLSDDQWESLALEGEYTRFERLLIHSIARALRQTDIDAASPRVLFVISTTKGNVELLDADAPSFRQRDAHKAILLGDAALNVARYFHNENTPVVVSNACISGVCAQIAAMRALESGRYDVAIVAGADVQSRFIVSGFQSFKALSPEECRPFDLERCGLNLGEAAATIIYNKVATDKKSDSWQAVRGAIRNDAYHISGVSRTGEGSYRALRHVLNDFPIADLALVNVHGTATLYNDEMESVALKRAGLASTPINSLKGYYGHTMGAAGILESALTMRALDDHNVLATRGFSELGVSAKVNISNESRPTSKRAFIKLISGFGGCNAALLFQKGGLQ